MRWTYGRLGTEARRIGRALVAAGVAPGDAVGVVMGNRPEAVAAIFGAALAGAVAAPMSTFSPRPELAHLVDTCRAAVVLTQPRLLARRFGDDLAAIAADRPHLRQVAVLGEPSWESLLGGRRRRDRRGPRRPRRGDHAGRPRSGHLLVRHDQRAQGHPPRPPVARAPVLAPGPALRPPPRHPHVQCPAAVLDRGAQHGGRRHPRRGRLLGGPGDLRARRRPGADGPGAGDRAVHAAPPDRRTGRAPRLGDHRPVVAALRVRQGRRSPAIPGWRAIPGGSCRSAGACPRRARSCAAHPSDTPRERAKVGHGALLPGARLRVVDPETGRLLGVDEEGELCVAGATRMLGYLGRPPEACFDEDGFFHTGDAGHVGADGNVHWSGRRTEMIKTGGANVSPAEVEVALRACPPVKLSRVLGVPDPRLDQAVVACVVLRDGQAATADDVRGFLRERVAAYKVPKHVLFFEPRRDAHDRQRCQGPRRRPARRWCMPGSPRPASPPPREEHETPTRPRPMPRSTCRTSTGTWACPCDRASSRRRSRSTTSGAGSRRCTTPTRCTTTSGGPARAAGARSWRPSRSPSPATPATARSPAQVGRIPGSHLIFGGDDWWFFGPRVRPGDKLVCHRMPYDYKVADTKFAGPDLLPAGRHALHQPAG